MKAQGSGMEDMGVRNEGRMASESAPVLKLGTIHFHFVISNVSCIFCVYCVYFFCIFCLLEMKGDIWFGKTSF